MESSKRIFGILIGITLSLLIYVHQQISIFQVSYSIEKKERKVAHLSEDYKRAKFQVSRLKSPHVLSRRMKDLSLDLVAPRDQKVVKILKPKAVPPKSELVWPAPFQFLSRLHFVKVAQAKTSK